VVWGQGGFCVWFWGFGVFGFGLGEKAGVVLAPSDGEGCRIDCPHDGFPMFLPWGERAVQELITAPPLERASC